jgi:hypothetical protein
MVAIIVSQPQDTASTPAPAWPRPVVTPGPGGVAGRPGPVGLADVTPLHPPTVSRPLPDRSTRIRRRRLVALLMAVALAAATIVTGQAVLSAFGEVEPSSPRPVEVPALSPTVGETYIVQPGDTLWSIAAAIAPDSDPRPVVDALRDANGGPDIQVGQRLTLVTE